MIRPLGHKVLIAQSEKQSVTDSGIALAHDTLDKTEACKGTVIAIGDSVTSVKADDVVAFEEFAGAEVSFNGKTYLIMSDSDIIGIY